MVLLVATPSILLPGTHAETTQVVALVALVGAIFTLIEYNSAYPSLVEFRDAPPFNRVRFFSLFAGVFLITVIARGQTNPTTITDFFTVIGRRVGGAIDFPYSPVRLVVLMMPDESSRQLIDNVRTAAGLSYLISILSLSIFVLVLRVAHWPARTGGFNVWINLPTFDPTAGGDVVERLNRDAQVNLVLGFLLPFLIPAIVKLASDLLNPISLENPHTLIWTMTAWAFLPASLFMRGIAMNRVAQMISNQRQRAYAAAQGENVAHA
ncbi:membrane protein, putative [Oceanicola granulosus HTCC2516]|uniref:Membrane protein, putative n=1 Tax=Oceanicola granulosus (strain ATCC BAA-861 / DSM 15982 / KCTC 12143 / HTCC2516) TaxID=314256 RepID=Q2CCY7_OCEGH|nr:membrane protein, putative [Oceanicola granulosus HTCC2516]